MATETVTLKNYTDMHPSGPKITFNGKVKVYRDNTSNKSVRISVDGDFKFSSYFNVPYSGLGNSKIPAVGLAFSVYNNIARSNYEELHPVGNITQGGKKVTLYGIAGIESASTITKNISWVQEWTGETLNIYSHCGFASNTNTSVHCSHGYTSTRIAQFTKPKYDPHTNPTISVPRRGYIC